MCFEDCLKLLMRVFFVIEGVLFGWFLCDFFFEGVGVVFFDEFYECSLVIDFGVVMM